jgi:predicted kinase
VSDSRRLVYVSGAPGSGKTSLAVPLAAELGCALLTKDRIKETLHDAFGAPEPDRAWSRRLGAAAMELMWALAADAPAVVIEANFRPYSDYERAKLSGLTAHPVEVHCACPPEVAIKRYNARVTHPVHVVTTLECEAMSQWDRPVGIGTLVTVDTTAPVDVNAVTSTIRDCYATMINLR